MSDDTDTQPPSVSVDEVIQPGVRLRRRTQDDVDSDERTDDDYVPPMPPQSDTPAPAPTPEPPPQPAPSPPRSQPMAQKRKRSSIINDIPRDELKALADSGVEVVQLSVRRRSPDGKIAMVYNNPTNIRDLFNGTFENELFKLAGGSGTGGSYEATVSDTADPLNNLNVPSWRFILQGQPKDPRHNVNAATPFTMAQGGYSNGQPQGMLPTQAFAGPGGIQIPPAAYQVPGVAVPTAMGPGQVTVPPQDQMPAWARSFPAIQQWPIYYETLQRTGRLPAGASMHSDMLAQGHAQTWQIQHSQAQAEVAKLQERLVALEKQARDTELAAQRKIEEMRAERDKEKYEGRIEALNSKIDAMATSNATKPTDYGHLAELAKIFGPALAAGIPAFITMLSDARRIETDRQLNTMKLSQEQQNTMLALVNKKSDTDWPKMLTAMSPILAQFLQNMSPQAQADLKDMDHQSKLMMLKMMNDMVIAQAEANNPDEPSWLPALRAIMESLSGVGGRLMQQQMMTANATTPQPPQPLPQPQPQPGAPTSPSPETPQEQQVWQHLSEIDAQAAANTRLVWEQIPREAGFHTHEWRILIFNMHAKAETEELAEKIVDHLQHLVDYQMVPPILQNVFDDPRDALEPIFMQLPIALPELGGDRDYMTKLLDAIVALINQTDTTPDNEIIEGVEEPDNANGQGLSETAPAV